MKAAICFYGLVGSRSHKSGFGQPLPPQLAHAYYSRHIFAHQECDVFIHSWSKEHEDILFSLYKPISAIIEPQRSFSILPKHLSRIPLKLRFKDKYLHFQGKREKECKAIENAYSRWYSSKKVLELAQEQEKIRGKKYDYIMVTRLDVGFFTDMYFSRYNPEIFWASHWNDPPLYENGFKYNYANHYKGKGFLDFWFFSNSENMNKFSCLFDNLEDYHTNPHIASYEHVRYFTDKIGYVFYRWQDHEMLRRRFFESEE